MLSTNSDTQIATGCVRIVHGGRGSYYEFTYDQLNWSVLHEPENQKWRHTDKWKNRIYYYEWRSTDLSNVKVYEQVRTVSYADYKVGMYYISLDDLKEKREDI